MSYARLTAALSVVLLALTAGCSTREWNNPAIPQLAANPIFPLAMGNQWTYVDSVFDTTGVFVRSDSVRIQLGAPTTLDIGGTLFTGYPWTPTDLVTNRTASALVVGAEANGMYVYGAVTPRGLLNIGVHEVYLRYPVALNDSWRLRDIYVMAGKDSVDGPLNGNPATDTRKTWFCRTPAGAFVVPAGAMTSVDYHTERDSVFNRKWPDGSTTIEHHAVERDKFFVPGVGYVGCVDKIDHRITYSERLIHYTLH